MKFWKTVRDKPLEITGLDYKLPLVLGIQPKPVGINNIRTNFYDNYIFRIGNKLIYVKWYRGNLTFRWDKNDDYQNISYLSVKDRVYIKQKINLHRGIKSKRRGKRSK